MDKSKNKNLVERLQNGEKRAVDELVDSYQGMLFQLIFRFVLDRYESEDLLQETFMRIIRRINSYEEQGRFESWMCKIAANLACDHLRSRKRKPLLYHDELETKPSSGKDNPASLFQEKEALSLLEKAVASLPWEQRQVFLLREEAGLSFKEISEELGVSINTALSRMHYAVKKLQNHLQRISP